MKNSSKLIVATLALASSAWLATAQTSDAPSSDQGPPPGGGPGHHRRPPPAIIGALDANHDGVIDAGEIANAAAALKTLDKNGDGQLTADEYLGPPPRPPGTNSPAARVRGDHPDGPPPGAGPDGAGHPPMPPIVTALDTNGDGVIDASEIANAPAALKTLDKNGDGQLTPDEFHPPHRGGPGGPGEGRGPGGSPPDDQQGAPPQSPSGQ